MDYQPRFLKIDFITLIASFSVVALLMLPGRASADLLDRGPDMVYDDVLNITWTRQGGDGVARNWADANAWAAGLVFGGFSDWRLPYASVSAGVGPITTLHTLQFGSTFAAVCLANEVACRDNEMAYMFYHNLGGTFLQNKTGTQTSLLGGQVLTGIQPFYYWSGTEFDSSIAWHFFFDGEQGAVGKFGQSPAWAVHPGDVAAIPEPETYAMMLAGLGLMGFVARRRKQNVA